MLWPTSWQVVPPRLLTALKLGCFSSVFPSHPPTTPSVRPPCLLLQGSCCLLAPTSESSPSPCPPGPARGGRCLFSWPRGCFPIHFVYVQGDMKHHPGSLGGCSCSQEPQWVIPTRAGRMPKPCWDPPAVFRQLLHCQGGSHCQLGTWLLGFFRWVQRAALQKQNGAKKA